MKRITLLLTLLLSLALQGLAETPVGNPNLPARLEFIYSSTKFAAKIDGQDLTPGEGMKIVQEFSPGKHMVDIFAIKGLFKIEPFGSTTIDLPGGYLTRAVLKDGVLQVLDNVPLPGTVPAAQPVPAPVAAPETVVTTTTVTTRTAGTPVATPTQTVTMGLGMPGMENMGVTMNVSGMESSSTMQTEETVTTVTTNAPVAVVAPVQQRPSKLVFLSEEGMCTVYIDGKKRTELPMSGIDEMATATVFDLMPGKYQLKVEGFEVWYDGIFTVGSGEEIKLRVEPNSLTEIGRNPLP
jgi:hypothetical protein